MRTSVNLSTAVMDFCARLRNVSGLAIMATCALFALTAPSAAKAPAVCTGDNLLAEFEITTPDVFRDILTAAAAIDNGEAVLWRVDKPGLAPSYLFGTVHLSDARVATLSDEVLGALASSTTLALEVADLSPDESAAAMQKVAPQLVFADGRRLNTILTPEEFAVVIKILNKSGMPPSLAPMLKPWIVSVVMAVSECERQRVAAGHPVLDMALAEKAISLGIPIVGLETIEQQLKALASVPLDDQVQILRAGLKYADRTDDLVETMIQLYLTRRISATMPFQLALAKKVGINPAVYKSFENELLTKRNVGMRNRALPLLAKGRLFLGVGALHLPGKHGLVTLLRDAGFTLTAIE